MILLLLVLVVIVLYLFMSWINIIKINRRINLDGPMPWPVFGNAFMFFVKSSEYLNLLAKLSLNYGHAYKVGFFSTPYVILNHPYYVEPLVTSTELITKGRSYCFLRCWLGNGLLTAGGHRWQVHRKFLTPAFHFNILHNFLPVFCKNQEVLTEKLLKLADGRPVNLFPIIALAALDNVTEAIMGVSVNAQNHSESEYVKAVKDATTIMAMRIQKPLLGIDFIFNLFSYKTKLDKALKILHRQSRCVIDARRAELNKRNITTLGGADGLGIRNKHAFLDLLLLTERNGHRIDDENIRQEVDTFMFEGHDTITSGIVFTLFVLSKHSDVQEKIFEEQKSIFSDDLHRDPTYTEIQQMKYLDMAIREAMRLYPPVPLIERYIVQDCVVGDIQLIEGTSVMINIFQCHRNPDVFEDPLEYKPERFRQPLKYPFDWLAFSAGPRNCIGQKFAMMELKTCISAIVRKFLLLPSHEEPVLCADLVLRAKNGVYVKLQPRF